MRRLSTSAEPHRSPLFSRVEAASSLKDFLRYQDFQFIECAYLTLLKRQPDTDGFRFYLDRLRDGAPKLQLIREIMESPEANIVGAVVPGLRKAVNLHKALSVVPRLGHGYNALRRIVKWRGLAQRFGEAPDQARSRLNPDDSVKVRMASATGAAHLAVEPRTAVPASTQNGQDAPAVDATFDGGLRLHSDRSVSEVAWLAYLERVINHRLIGPLRKAGTPPPAHSLIILIDCTESKVSSEQQKMTMTCLSTLVAASEYPVRPYLYRNDYSDGKLSDTAAEGDPCPVIVSKPALKKCIGDGDLVLVLKPGDEIRPEIHMALKFFGAFNAEFTLIDLYIRDDERIFPYLLHAVDPIHASHCDYFLGRYVANGKIFKATLDRLTSGSLATVGTAVCSAIDTNDRRCYRHISIPLLCANTRLSELAETRAAMVMSGTHDIAPVNFASNRNPRLDTAHAGPQSTACVSAVICTKDCGLLLRQLLYRLELEPLISDIVIVSNNTTNPHALRTLASAFMKAKVKILDYPGAFNFSRQCNLGAKYALGSELLLLNDDIVPVTDDWLECLHGWTKSGRVVGPLLIYPNQSVQHAGMHLGFNGVAGHVLRHSKVPTGDYGFLLTAPRRVSCLTGAALLMPRKLFESLNGFDPMLATYLQDVDLSLRALNSGSELILDPRSVLIHMESLSVIPTLEDARIRRSRELEYSYFANRWSTALNKDEWMNPLFDPMDESLTALRV